MNDHFGVLILLGVFAGAVHCFFRGAKEKKVKGRETVALLFVYQGICSLGFIITAVLYASLEPEGSVKLLFMFIEGIVIGVWLGIYMAMRTLGFFSRPES